MSVARDRQQATLTGLWDAHGARQRRMARAIGEERAAECMDPGVITQGMVRVATRDLDRLLDRLLEQVEARHEPTAPAWLNVDPDDQPSLTLITDSDVAADYVDDMAECSNTVYPLRDATEHQAWADALARLDALDFVTGPGGELDQLATDHHGDPAVLEVLARLRQALTPAPDTSTETPPVLHVETGPALHDAQSCDDPEEPAAGASTAT